MATSSLAPLPNSRTEPDGSAVVRVLSYNVRSMRDDTDALARIVTACAPDLVLLQEAPRLFRWRKKITRLAAASGLVLLSGGGTAAGPALLCSLRATVERTEDVLLPLTPGRHRRGLAAAVVRIGGARLGVLSTHLSLSADERHEQAGLLLDHLAALGVTHAVAGGDLNEPPGGRTFRRLGEGLRDCWTAAPWGGEYTFPATAPDRRIDAVFVTEDVEVLGCGVPSGLPGVAEDDLRAATDHLPVLTALRVPATT
ncbi:MULTISPECIES: endonuclease/exonuclease/phosphatase family protein [Streptomyces]|uniref:endonuclease/exonuclease/phosphatase family protein n=1 Tax=Streptomyces TaxID=1883 RepID=UPI001885958B|nr:MULTISPECIES: endonuclease/exonuclease/phosphatase family protein [Streptomyces]MBF8175537.1 endonuclease/exonuclease/phosphatase family protein [Streptomyces olivaceus]MBZ6131905.1 endonuclease/exonuclease/phosphatase family protein [Streptomyces olivaceus]MBZ6260494.1 endonuclease/exonuclease/phosphatase family protein [Streptomyces olivaceus]MCM8555074.1 endonuclease/exonuclease/phosphatase family protein [Streptomyces sp. STCH 565 A]MCU8592039.1 endonuclease/exonuclease/phosphatase fami